MIEVHWDKFYFFKTGKRNEFLDGRTCNWLAKKMNMSYGHTNRIINGHRGINGETLRKMLVLTDKPLNYYFEKKDVSDDKYFN